MARAPTYSFRETLLWGESRGQIIHLILRGLGIASSFFILATVSVYLYGLYQLILTAVAVAVHLTSGLFDEAVTNDLARATAEGKRKDAKRLAAEYIGAKTIIAFAVWALVFFGAELIARYYDQDIGGSVRIASFLVLFPALRTMQVLFFRATVSFAAFGAEIIAETTRLGLLVALWWQGGLTLGEVLWAGAIASGVTLAYTSFYFFRRWRELFTGIAPSAGWILPGLIRRYGVWVLTRYAVSRAAKGIDVWYVRVFLNTEAVGLYAFAVNLLTIFQGFVPTAMLGVLLPWEAGDRGRLAIIYRRMLKYGVWVGTAVALGAALVAPPIIYFAMPKYEPALPLVLLLLTTLPLYAVYKYQKSFLVTLREQELLAKRFLSEIAINAVIAFTLLPLLKLYAMALTFLVDYGGRVGLYTYYLRRRYPELTVRFRDFFTVSREDRDLFRAVVASVLKPRWWIRRPANPRIPQP
ncbi:hypothetical protein C4552_02910 [Candidatus Parcubacteria bacterium]|nr:MAG: hypothetical protein C4552_02910 [Candidatus Parcubacteria bacterium]